MKTFPLYLLLLFVATLSFSSCALDEEIDIPGGGTDAVSKYLGSWSVTDNAAKLNYEVNIDRNSSNSSMVVLRNFAGSGANADGLVVSNSLIVEDQLIGAGWRVAGTGKYINEDKLNFTYTLEIGGNVENRVATFSR
ncbi:MAG: hypothetical protein AB7D35_03530 [Bacteroidales bacterium]|nr:hypothetical protein [Bacteroidales bacterium]MDD4086323.1 hypothetical protein [Bacteroidales bacterium]